jgi:alkylation response protein AidB-like acyl-CoA dehydrogenase
VKERRQFGKAIAEFQGVQFMLADMAMKVEVARHLISRSSACVAVTNVYERNTYPVPACPPLPGCRFRKTEMAVKLMLDRCGTRQEPGQAVLVRAAVTATVV